MFSVYDTFVVKSLSKLFLPSKHYENILTLSISLYLNFISLIRLKAYQSIGVLACELTEEGNSLEGRPVQRFTVFLHYIDSSQRQKP